MSGGLSPDQSPVNSHIPGIAYVKFLFGFSLLQNRTCLNPLLVKRNMGSEFYNA